jgi:hypothetical protein
MPIAGRCHCGNIRFELDWTPEPAEIPARACDCSFCRRHGAVWTACPTASLRITIAESSRTSRYAFDTRTADFLVCSHCGIVPAVTSRIDGRLYAVVNVNTLENVESLRLRHASVSLEGENENERLDRRKHNWIGYVVCTHDDG